MSWPMVAFKDVAKVVTGSTPKQLDENYGGSVPFVTPGDLGLVNEISDAKRTLTDKGALSVRPIPKGSVMVCCIGATIGKVGIATKQVVTNQQINSLVFDESKVFPKYAFYFSLTLKPLLVAKSSSTTMPIVNKSNFSEFEMPLPPLEEQKRIASILDKADAVRQKRKQAIDLADEFLSSVFLDMFGEPVSNPKGWKRGIFGDVISLLTDYHANGSYQTLSSNVTLLDAPDYAYMVRTTDLAKKNHIDNVKYISESAYHHLAKSKVFGGEIIMNKIGSAGATYLMPSLNRPVSLAMNQFMINCNMDSCNMFYYYQLQTQAGKSEIEKRVQGAVTKTITKDAVREIPIIIPPKELQFKFKNIADSFRERLKVNMSDAVYLDDELFNALSQKAFSGKL
ncbi:MAG: restriction endonuclease subunit S [Moritella sp.]|uniref:restriction endonuclease subunit S n=1 Tax=Moritella sp. TaxID=78556 RepID=UPI001D61494A|nr:restriction endonuclease subunit S [Moritella sp.]NQZ50306.1 restriction endonuclease subunit S [Moritella sp.]